VRRAAEFAIKESACYPDPFCRALTRALAEREGVQTVANTLRERGGGYHFRVAAAKHPKRAVLLAPCFDEYEAALRTAGCHIAFETLTEQTGFAPTEHILRLLVPGVDVLFLGDPNNPTGITIGKPLFEAIVRRCGETGIFLVLDRSFEDFLEHGLPKSPASPGIFVIKAFTKFYAMAGLRLGYGVCRDEALLETMRTNAQPWSVSTPAQAAGLAALMEDGFAKKRARLSGWSAPISGTG
jgi:threonine-phosphate decarboxylase